MKFDLDTAWKDAMHLLRESFGLLTVIAGVFYFLPYLAAMLWVPGLAELSNGQFEPGSDQVNAMANEMLAGYWWALLLVAILQSIGFLAMLSLLRRRVRPTVGQALEQGAKSVPTYLIATFLFVLGMLLVGLLLISISAATGLGALAFGIAALVFVAFVYLFVKFSLLGPVIAMNEERNPVRALLGSWHLTKGSSLRLFFFYALLFIAYFVIAAVVSLLFTLVFALGGAEAQEFGQAFSSSLMNALAAVIFTCVLAAVYRQCVRLRTSAEVPTVTPDDD